MSVLWRASLQNVGNSLWFAVTCKPLQIFKDARLEVGVGIVVVGKSQRVDHLADAEGQGRLFLIVDALGYLKGFISVYRTVLPVGYVRLRSDTFTLLIFCYFYVLIPGLLFLS